MPTTRRKRANPPDQPENNNHIADQPEASTEALLTPKGTEAPPPAENTATAGPQQSGSEPQGEQSGSGATGATPVSRAESVPYQPMVPPPVTPQLPAVNGDRGERIERQEYTPTIEGGKRTSRGELFRRPPQAPVPPVAVPQLQPPSHEIRLPLGKELGDTRGDPLHLAYNPSYTGSDEARSSLLHQLAIESKSGGRGRCWSCGSMAIVYERWNTRNKAFGEVGVAFCEICGVWSVM